MESIDGKARISERKRRDTCAFVYGGFIRIRESPNGRGPCLNHRRYHFCGSQERKPGILNINYIAGSIRRNGC